MRWWIHKRWHPMSAPTHPDNGWWNRLAKATQPTLNDICRYCPHIRGLHNAGGCTAKARGLFDARACDCDNVGSGELFSDPKSLRYTVREVPMAGAKEVWLP